jgi:hypothetical protein
VVADGVVRASAEDRIAAELTGIPGVEARPDVTIGGRLFLTQVAAGQIASLVVTAPAATVEGLRMEDVQVRLTQVTTSPPYTAEVANLTALVRPEAIEAVLAADLDLAIRDGLLVTSATVLGLPLDVTLVPRAAGRAVEVDVTGLTLGGIGVDIADLPSEVVEQLSGVQFTVSGLPDGMALTGIDVEPDGLRLRAVGRDLALTGG